MDILVWRLRKVSLMLGVCRSKGSGNKQVSQGRGLMLVIVIMKMLDVG